jgi:hypothetical protein
VFVGSVLVALLLVAGWIWPSSEPAQDAAAQAAADAPVARIHSAQKWPDKIEFDTSRPTIVPPPAPVAAETTLPAPAVATHTAAASPLDARAEAKRNVESAPAPRRQARVHHRYYARQATSTSRWANTYPSRWANATPTAPSSWSWNW